jgi:hypothetical protein
MKKFVFSLVLVSACVMGCPRPQPETTAATVDAGAAESVSAPSAPQTEPAATEPTTEVLPATQGQ